MPAFVIVRQSGKRGDAVDAVLCAPGVLGFPDRKTDVPVKATIAEKTIRIDDEPRARAIISSTSINGVTTFLIDGSSKGLRNRERRVALARASELLKQLTASLMALRAESADPEPVAENLQRLFDWITRERERATGAPKGVPR